MVQSMTASSHPSVTARMESAALALAEEYESNTLRCHGIPINEMGDPLTAADISEILLSLPCDVPLRSLVLSVENQYKNISDKLIAHWCLIRQQLEGGEDENETPPPPPTLDNTMPTHLPERGSSSFALRSIETLPMAPSTNASDSVSTSISPILDLSPTQATPNISTSTSDSALSPSELALPHFPQIPSAIPLVEPDAVLSDGDVVATPSEDLKVAPAEQDEEEADGLLAPDFSVLEDKPEVLSTQDEEKRSASTTSPPSLTSRSPPSSPQLRSNAVLNFQELRPALQLQDNTITTLPLTPLPPLTANLGGNNFQLPTGTDREDMGVPSVVAGQHSSTVSDRNEGGRTEGKRSREDNKGSEDGSRYSKRAGGPSMVAGQHASGSPGCPDEGGRACQRGGPGRPEGGEASSAGSS
ncbi:hypothetical protein BDZ89DRAFT_1066766 [Hymenopellis radicata]|nr:hypothetical protein BDZ89DRAFT_1066766 [Hymenopellis radicata]